MTYSAPESNTTTDTAFAFRLQMHHAGQEAARQGFPVCAVKFDDIVEVDEVFYGVTWTSRGGASKTMPLDATVTNLDTGRSLGFENIIRKILKTYVSYHVPRKGTCRGRTNASHVLAEQAAPHTQALVLHNPVTGPVFVVVGA